MNLNLVWLFPEWVGSGILIILLFGEILSGRSTAHRTPANTTVVVGSLLVFLAVLPFAGRIGSSFGGMFILDPLASFFKAFFALVLFVVVFMGRVYFRQRLEKTGEFFIVLWVTLLGACFLVSANDFLLLFIALELVTLSFYIAAAYLKQDLRSIEAGVKYLILGSLASAFMIFGIALIYTASGTTSFPEVREALMAQPENRIFTLGILFVLSGLGFKIAAVPFQLWVPDVYEGAPTPVVAYLAVGSKAAGFAVLLRLLFTVFSDLEGPRVLLFSVLAAMTLVYGNFGALVQTNIKRLMGYSSIGHAGYLMIGLAAGGRSGAEGVLYYLMAYAVSNLAAFLVITVAGKSLESDSISSYRGLAKRSPLLAGTFFVALLSLAGVPPLAGFFGKFLVLLAAVGEGLGWLACLGALSVAVSLFYYLSVVKTLYLEEPPEGKPITVSHGTCFYLLLLTAATLGMGFFQAPFFFLARQAAGSLF